MTKELKSGLKRKSCLQVNHIKQENFDEDTERNDRLNRKNKKIKKIFGRTRWGCAVAPGLGVPPVASRASPGHGSALVVILL